MDLMQVSTYEVNAHQQYDAGQYTASRAHQHYHVKHDRG